MLLNVYTLLFSSSSFLLLLLLFLLLLLLLLFLLLLLLLLLQAVDIRHIADKFPEKNGGLKELFEKGPQDRFFLVKFWADINTPLLDDNNAFYGVTSQ